MAFTDNFNRADENLSSSADWTLVSGSGGEVVVVSNQLGFVSGANGFVQSPDEADADHFVSATRVQTTSNSGFEVCIRATTETAFFGVRYVGAWQLYKNNSGFSLLGSYSSTPSGSNVMRLEAEGDSITFILDGTTRIGPITDTFNNTVTRCATFNRGEATEAMLDDWETGVLGGGGGGATISVLYRHYQSMMGA